MELVDLLTKDLGVSVPQAEGGAGLIFKLAKDKLPAADFSKVASAVPGIQSLISAAPAAGGGAMGGLGSMLSGLGGAAGNLGNLASLAGGFSKLGLDKGMVGKFIPIIMNFVQSKGGAAVSAILQKVLK